MRKKVKTNSTVAIENKVGGSRHDDTISLRGGGSIKQQTIAGSYISTIVHLILAFILNVVYHHQSAYNNNIASFKPKWEVTNLQPYMGNLTCMFEVGYWNLESQKNPNNLNQRRTCGNLRYIPSIDYIPSNVDLVFDKLLSHGENPTIYT